MELKENLQDLRDCLYGLRGRMRMLACEEGRTGCLTRTAGLTLANVGGSGVVKRREAQCHMFKKQTRNYSA
jgi:hypothetical protein